MANYAKLATKCSKFLSKLNTEKVTKMLRSEYYGKERGIFNEEICSELGIKRIKDKNGKTDEERLSEMAGNVVTAMSNLKNASKNSADKRNFDLLSTNAFNIINILNKR